MLPELGILKSIETSEKRRRDVAGNVPVSVQETGFAKGARGAEREW